MLRVGLTGGLGSGKSTVARMLSERGAIVLESDALGRDLMQPGEAVYAEIVARFGPAVVRADGTLDRQGLARLAFNQGRVEELNAIVHPAVIERQERLIKEIAAVNESAVIVVESALIFETHHGGPGGWRQRFDRIVLVTAPEATKIARFVERSRATKETKDGLEAEARRRLAVQMPDAVKMPSCDYVLENDGDLARLEAKVQLVWLELHDAARP